MTFPVDHKVDVDFLILSDWAQVLGGKLYLQGGGWDTLTAANFPHQQNIGVALSLRVPWNATNQRYSVDLDVANDDTQEALLKLHAELETGRPPGIPPGTDQFVMIALNGAPTLSRPGSFVIRASVNGEESRRKVFRVMQGPRSPAQ